MGLGTILDHAAAAAQWPVDNGAFEEKLDAVVIAASKAAVLACELRDTTGNLMVGHREVGSIRYARRSVRDKVFVAM